MVYYRSIDKKQTIMTRTFHPTKAYKMTDKRQYNIEMMNEYVRAGISIAYAAELLGFSTTTGYRLYFGYADYCLPYNGMSRDPRSVIYEGASCCI
jgi:hypothetical protein